MLTHDPKIDDPGLIVSLPSDAFYVGALGSQKTRAARRERLLEAGLPLELVRRRPDMQQSYALLLAADRDMASAVRNKYPRISINTRGQLRANNFANLFDNWAYSIAGNLLAPLFYGGQLSAEVNRNEAIKQQRLFEYGQATLLGHFKR